MHRNPLRWSAAGAIAIGLALVLPLAACTPPTPGTTATTSITTSGTPSSEASKAIAEQAAKMDVILASTPSAQESGLLDALVLAFQQGSPQYLMKVIPIGSAQALAMGQKKGVDVVLVEAPSVETSFVANGFGTGRKPVMNDDFIVVGPSSDPARIKGLKVAADALKQIAAASSPFVSPGPVFGADAEEASLWAAAAVTPTGKPWYTSTGKSMGETLRVAGEKHAYAVVDRATWFAGKAKTPGLTILVQGDPKLVDPYDVILVSGAKNPAGGKAFADWLVSSAGQKAIGDYGVAKYGQQLFIPSAGASN